MDILKCELCGDEWYDETAGDLVEQVESIQDTKRCIGCVNEWGDQWPDRV